METQTSGISEFQKRPKRCEKTCIKHAFGKTSQFVKQLNLLESTMLISSASNTVFLIHRSASPLKWLESLKLRLNHYSPTYFIILAPTGTIITVFMGIRSGKSYWRTNDILNTAFFIQERGQDMLKKDGHNGQIE